jgi:hypothetical protein
MKEQKTALQASAIRFVALSLVVVAVGRSALPAQPSADNRLLPGRDVEIIDLRRQQTPISARAEEARY